MSRITSFQKFVKKNSNIKYLIGWNEFLLRLPQLRARENVKLHKL